jgi:ABC-type transport system involved in multi-copper enzyme maturation permease subunit
MTSLLLRWRTLLYNPVTVKELRSRMRGNRAFVVLSVYLFILVTLVSLIYLSIVVNANRFGSSTLSSAGEAVFVTVLVAQAFLVIFVTPVFTTGAITGEKERQTYEILRTTMLSPAQFIWGKLLSGVSYVLILVFAAIPILSIAFILGGVTPRDLMLTQLELFVTTVTFSIIGLYISSRTKTTLTATVTTLAIALTSLTAGPMFFIMNDALDWNIYFPEDGMIFLGLTNLAFSLSNIMNDYVRFDILLMTVGYLAIYAGISIILFWLTVKNERKTTTT